MFYLIYSVKKLFLSGWRRIGIYLNKLKKIIIKKRINYQIKIYKYIKYIIIYIKLEKI